MKKLLSTVFEVIFAIAILFTGIFMGVAIECANSTTVSGELNRVTYAADSILQKDDAMDKYVVSEINSLIENLKEMINDINQ